MSKRRILLLFLVLILLIPSMQVLGYDVSDDEEERDLVRALVFMAAHSDTANGGLSADELYAIRDHVGAYYDRNILYAKQAGASDLQAFWEGEKKADLAKIKKASYAAWVEENEDWMYFLTNFFRSLTNPDPPKLPDPKLANTVAQGAARASQAGNVQDTQQNQSLLAASAARSQDTSYSNLITSAYISNDLTRIPDSAPILQAAYGDLSISLLSDSTANPVEYDGNESNSEGPDPAPVQDSEDQAIQNHDVLDDGSALIENRPVRFDNTGSRAVTVLVQSYQGDGTNPVGASTVVFSNSSSAAYLELPLGEYQFCYYWETDSDENNDGYFDYRHAQTGSVTLTENSPADPGSAKMVSLSTESTSASSGKCSGETILEQDNLTPEELLNQGTHNYNGNCIYWDGDQSTNQITVTIEFNEQGAIFTSPGSDPLAFDRIGLNTYKNDSDDILSVITIKDYGFIDQAEGFGYKVTCDCQRLD